MKRLQLLLGLAATILLFAGNSAKAQTVFPYTGDFVTYTVPAGVTSIGIEALGAQGASGNPAFVGGNGAKMYGEFTVTPGDVLIIAVGGMGQGQSSGSQGGGGGGSFVVLQNTSGAYTFTGGLFSGTSFDLMVIAGGGGGTRASSAQNGNPGVITEEASTGSGSASTGGGATSATAVGNGGIVSWTSYGSAGAGLLTDGADDGTWGTGGDSFLSGAVGGISTGCGSGDAAEGGFGCGGSGGGCWGGGGGGGYTGGEGGFIGGGGGSYNSGTAQDNVEGFNPGDGLVTITDLCTGLTSTISDDTVCNGDMVTIHAASTVGGTITWDGGVTDSVAFTPPLGATTYTATSSDPGDCGFSVTIFVGDIPTVDAGADQDVCEGDSTMVNASGTATDYTWDGGVLDGVNFLPPSGTTTYTATGTIDSTGCQATDMVDVTVVVPDVSITSTGSMLTCNQAGATYQWLDCPGLTPIAGETNQSFTPSVDGDYAVIVTLSGCSDTSSCQAVYAGVKDLSQDDKPHVYPNPAEEMITVFAKGEFTYQLIGMKGELIQAGQAKDETELFIKELPAGAYMINVITEFGVMPIKVMKK